MVTVDLKKCNSRKIYLHKFLAFRGCLLNMHSYTINAMGSAANLCEPMDKRPVHETSNSYLDASFILVAALCRPLDPFCKTATNSAAFFTKASSRPCMSTEPFLL